MSEPKLTEVRVHASVGGKIQIVKFEYHGDYSCSFSRAYSIPEDWTNDQAVEFQKEVAAQIRQDIDGPSQQEIDGYMDLRDQLANG